VAFGFLQTCHCSIVLNLRRVIINQTDASSFYRLQPSLVYIFLGRDGINVVVELKSVEGREASSTLEDAFITMSNVVSNDYVTVQHIQEKDIIRHCLEPFTKEDGSFTFRSEVVTNKAINFFNWCHNKSLLEESNGEKIYENMLLPFFVQALKRYPSNEKIQINAFNFLEYTCTVIDDKSKIEAAGAMEVLSSMLIAPDIHAEKKKRIRRLIIAITA
jgi:hypothetical protein